MLVIYGSKEYREQLDNHPSATCPHCGYDTQMTLTHVYKRATLYYIPMFAVDRKVYAQCPHCGGYSEVRGNSMSEVRKGRIDRLEVNDLKAVGTNAIAATSAEDVTNEAGSAAGMDMHTGADMTPGTEMMNDAAEMPGTAEAAAVRDTATTAPSQVRAPWEKPVHETKPGDGFRTAGGAAVVFAVILGISSLFGIRGAAQRSARTYIPLNDLLAQDRELTIGTYVTVDVDAVIGNYASETGRGAREYYMIWLDDNTMMSLETSDREDIAVLNRLEEDTLAYLNGKSSKLGDEVLPVKGVLRATSRMNSSLQIYYGNLAEAIGLRVGDGTVRPFHIETVNDTDPKATTVKNAVLVALTLACIVLAAVFFTKAKKEQSTATNQI